MRPRPRRNGPMPVGRTCAGAGCATRLSVYNRGDLCSICDQGRTREAAIRTR
jgi:hypothetical protein